MRPLASIRTLLKTRSLREVSFVYAGSLLNGASLLALNIVLARGLTLEMFGIFSLAIMVLGTVAEMSDFGLNAGLLRFAPYYLASGDEDKFKQLIKIIWRWRVTLTAVLTIGSAVASYPLAYYLFGQPAIAPYVLYASLGIGGVVLLGFLATYLQARQRFYYNSTLQALKGFLRLALVVILWLEGVTSLFAYLTVYIFIPWILFFLNFHLFPAGFTRQLAGEEIKQKIRSQLGRFSFWLTVSSFTAIVGSRIDQVMISHYLGLAEVAIFTAAFQFIQLFPIIYNSINSVLTPKISGLKSKTEVAALVVKTFKWMCVATLAIAIVIYPSQYLIILLFGSNYSASMPVYVILAYALLLNVLTIPFSLTITVFNQTHLVAASGAVHLIVNVIANLILIPRYGIIGAAYAFAISVVVLVAWNTLWALYILRNKELVMEE